MPNGQINLIWGDGEQVFNIAQIKYLLELEDKCGSGVREILTRINEQRWKVNDLRETLRLGLIGGGKSPEDALKLINRYFDERPIMESAQPAFLVLAAAIVGVKGEDVGKKQTTDQPKTEAETQTPSSVPMAASPDPSSTASAQPSDLPQEVQTI